MPEPNKDRLTTPEKDSGFGLCVARTVESISSAIAGKQLELDPEPIAYRIEQMNQAQAQLMQRIARPDLPGHFRKRVEEHNARILKPKLFGPAVRMDKIAMSGFIHSLAASDTEIGDVLSQSEILFEQGSLDDALQFIQDGWNVGIVTALADRETGNNWGNHVFHLGLENGELATLSDSGDTKDLVDGLLMTGKLGEAMEALHDLTGGWNILLMG